MAAGEGAGIGVIMLAIEPIPRMPPHFCPKALGCFLLHFKQKTAFFMP